MSRLYELAKMQTVPYYLGFVQGHSHLDQTQLDKIEALIDRDESDEVSEYEAQFAALVGGGRVISFAAGRMAFFSLMKALGIGLGDEVVLLGFTCSVMANAVLRTGAVPVYADVDPDTFGSNAITIRDRISNRTKLIVAQHSFGIPCAVDEIVDLGKSRNIPVIEDCAITLGSSVAGIKVGNWGDAAIFSTDHSKPLNTILGGVFYTRREDIYKRVKTIHEQSSFLSSAHKRKLFAQLLFERNYFRPHRYQRARLMMSVKAYIENLGMTGKTATFLTDDFGAPLTGQSRYAYPARFPPFLAQLGLFEIQRWPSESKRRRRILQSFLQITANSDLAGHLPSSYFDKSLAIIPLRFAFQTPERDSFVSRLRRFMETDWIWFQSPIIACSDSLERLGYRNGSCSISERIGPRMVNMPCVIEETWENKLLEDFRNVLFV